MSLAICTGISLYIFVVFISIITYLFIYLITLKGKDEKAAAATTTATIITTTTAANTATKQKALTISSWLYLFNILWQTSGYGSIRNHLQSGFRTQKYGTTTLIKEKEISNSMSKTPNWNCSQVNLLQKLNVPLR